MRNKRWTPEVGPPARAFGEPSPPRMDMEEDAARVLFDPLFYLEQNPDVAESGIEPLVHYMKYGAREGRDPHPLFCVRFYLKECGNHPEAKRNPLVHYVAQGARQGKNPHPAFDSAYYLGQCVEPPGTIENPLLHYISTGAKEGKDPHPMFDTAFYLKQCENRIKAQENPLLHYLERGAKEGKEPHPLFDSVFYLKRNRAITKSGQNPLAHFLEYGASGGLSPSPWFKTAYYLKQFETLPDGKFKPLLHYLAHGAEEKKDPCPEFDTSYYMDQYPDVSEGDVNPLVHYLALGIKEQRDPTEFSKLRRTFSRAIQQRDLILTLCAYTLRNDPHSADFEPATVKRLHSLLRSLAEHLRVYNTCPNYDLCSANRLLHLLDENSLIDSKLRAEIETWAHKIWELNKAIVRLNRMLRRYDTPCEGDECGQIEVTPFAAIQKSKNAVLNDLEIIQGREVISSYPRQLLVDCTSACNFRCKICFQSYFRDIPLTTISEETVRAVRALLPFAEGLLLAGTGEPLLSARTISMAREAERGQVRVELVTNGSQLKQMREVAPYVRDLVISFDGGTEATFETLRFGGKLGKVVENIEGLGKELRRKIVLTVTVNRMNLGELGEIARIGEELGVGRVNFQKMLTYLPWHGQIELCREDQEVFESQMEEVRERMRRAGVKVTSSVNFSDVAPEKRRFVYDDARALLLRSGTSEPAAESAGSVESLVEKIEGMERHALPPAMMKLAEQVSARVRESDKTIDLEVGKLRSTRAKIPYCLAPWTHLFVTSTGDCRLCCVSERVLGNLFESDFRDIWNGHGYRSVRRVLGTGRDVLEECRSCHDPLRYKSLSHVVETALDCGVGLAEIEVPGNWQPMEIELTTEVLQLLKEVEGSSAEGGDERGECQLADADAK